jgi:hypothetical protein
MAYYLSNTDCRGKPACYNGYRNFSNQQPAALPALTSPVGCHQCAVEQQYANYVGAPNPNALAATAEAGGSVVKNANTGLLICLTITVGAFIAAIIAIVIIIPVVTMSGAGTTTPAMTTSAGVTVTMDTGSTTAASSDTTSAATTTTSVVTMTSVVTSGVSTSAASNSTG